MPENMNFVDIRRGSDVEFGQSTYEPFGISQLEPLSFGTLCVVSEVCGCVGFVRAVNGKQGVPNVIIADYTDIGASQTDLKDLLAIDRAKREVIEEQVAAKVAAEILKRLPSSQEELAKLIDSGHQLASKMSWEKVVDSYVLPALDRAFQRDQSLASA
jgi:glycogen synthase